MSTSWFASRSSKRTIRAYIGHHWREPANVLSVLMLEDVENILIQCDSREDRSAVVPALREMEGVQVEVATLEVGDYLVDDRLCVERKATTDLVVSILDGRLFRQAIRMANSRHRGVVVLEGTDLGMRHSDMSREAIQGALIQVSVFLGIALLRSLDAEETARLMVYAARQARMMRCRPISLQQLGRRPRGLRAQQLRVLQSLPGIGGRRAETLLDRFGSLEALFSAEDYELEEVTGIGPGTAREIAHLTRSRQSSEHGSRKM